MMPSSTTAVQDAMKGSSIRFAQNKCSTNITDLLQTLKDDGLYTILDAFIGEWRAPLTLDQEETNQMFNIFLWRQ